MPRLTKIYTRSGDEGNTSLGNRQRVAKNSARVEAYGTVDELNSLLGFSIAQKLTERLTKFLSAIQNELFHLGADLSYPEGDGKENKVPRIEQRHIDALEKLIDELNGELGPLENFILPGGSPGAASLQIARAVCRRAERNLVGLAENEQISPLAIAYLNRLSDALFVMSRYENMQKKVEEPLWDSRA
jgi:cob(I)alamin adenosyltransferase